MIKQMSGKKYSYAFVALLALILCFYLFRLLSSFNFDNDFGRDIVDILSISRGDMRLLGPKLSFGGIHASPWYYYLFVPVIFLFSAYPESVVIFSGVISALVLVAGYLLLTRILTINQWKAILLTLSMALSPAMVFSARNPGNAFSYIPFLFLSFICGYASMKMQKYREVLFFCFVLLSGMAVGSHPVSLLAILPFGLLVLWKMQKISLVESGLKRRLLVSFMALFLFFLPVLPNILFEFTHGFVQIKNTFIDKSYVNFIEDKNLSSTRPKTSQNLLENARMTDARAMEWGIPLLVLILAQFVVVVKDLVRKTWSLETSLVATSIVSWVLLVVLLRWQYAFHYLFPLYILVLFVSAIYVTIREKWVYVVVLSSVLTVLSISRLQSLYVSASRPIADFRITIDFILPFIQNERNIPTNVYLVRKEGSTEPHGHEYRYFLRVAGYTIMDVNSYTTSNRLLIFDESKEAKITQLRSWEIDQFKGSAKALRCKSLGEYTRVNVWLCEK